MQLLNHVLSRKKITPFSLDKEQKEGKGFSYKGKDFIHHSGLHHTATAFYRFSVPQMVGIFLMFLVLTISFAVNWHVTVEVIIALFTGLYFLDLLFNLYLIYRSFAKSSEITILPNELASVPENSWPSYTILCPLYNEWEVVPQFISAMRSLEYPKEKLQVLLLLEANDRATIEKIRNFSIPPYFEIVVVPQSFPKTKPKACNYGLLRYF